MRRTIQIELNELCPTLVDELVDAGELPNFRRLRDRSEVFVTDASGELNLEPWVQWPTLHTGIPDRDHGIEQLGQAQRIAGRGIARELAGAGFRVGVFGSMNVDYGPLDGFVVPDAWNAASPPHPADLSAYADFVSSSIQESSAASIDRAKALRFGRYVATHGLAPTTAMAAARQLADERSDDGVTWRRALVLDSLAYDVFRNLVRRHAVAYATFFSNSTAHMQHYYWRNFRPGEFSSPPRPEDHPSLSDAVVDGYRNHDRLIGRVLADFPDDRIIFATALSQQPWDTEKCTYRPQDFLHLLDLAGVDRSRATVEPVMAEEFFLVFADADSAGTGLDSLRAATVDGEPLFRFDEEDRLRVKLACAVTDWSHDDGIVEFADGRTAEFSELFYRIHGVRSGRHHPDGCLWITSRTPRRAEGKVALTAVAPTVLGLFGVDAPSYMKEPPIALAGEAV